MKMEGVQVPLMLLFVLLASVQGTREESTGCTFYAKPNRSPGTGSVNHGEYVNFSCAGKTLLWPELARTSQCLNGEMTPAPPLCHNIPDRACFVNSSPHRQPSNVYMDPGTSYFTCDPGYMLEGGNSANCYAGIWRSELPRCVPAKCTLHSIQGGLTVDNATTRVIPPGTPVRYSCRFLTKSYRLNGPADSVCSENGQMIPAPATCERRSCKIPSLFGLDNVPQTVYLGERVEWNCNSQYILVGAENSTCSEDFTFVPPPPTCKVPRECSVPRPAHSFSNTTTPTVYSTERVEFWCDRGRYINGSSTLTCDFQGNWNPPPPTCDRYRNCSFTTPERGSTNATSPIIQHGDGITYYCSSGYEVNGTGIATCTNGIFNHPPPLCSNITCTVPDPVNGRAMRKNIFPGEWVDYQCHGPGYRLSYTKSYCQQGGTLTPSSVTCDPLYCNVPRPVNGNASTTSVRFNGTVSFACNIGYQLSSNATRYRCNRVGNPFAVLNDSVPTCNPVKCFLGPIFNGQSDLYAVQFGQKATLTCNPGYDVYSHQPTPVTHFLHCTSRGGRIVLAPDLVCKPNICPQNLANGKVTYLSTGPYVGNYARFQCNPGYEKNGVSQSQCVWTSNGDRTSITHPTCTVVTCNVHTSGNVRASANRIDFNTSVTFSCIYAGDKIDNHRAICQADGSLSPLGATCTYTCNVPWPTNGKATKRYNAVDVEVRKVDARETVYFHCTAGYKLVGSSQATCSFRNKLTPHIPTCAPVTCNARGIPNSNHPQATVLTYISPQLVIKCNPGYVWEAKAQGLTWEGKLWSGCGYDGTMRPVLPNCIPQNQG